MSEGISTRPIRAQVNLVRELTEAVGVSGDEAAVRKLVRSRIVGVTDELRTDSIGNLIAIRRSVGRRRMRAMLAAHMDEVGFMLVAADPSGGFKFEHVGGLDPRDLLGKRVWIGRGQIPGIIGGKPIHLAESDELKKLVKTESMLIDVGADSKEAALKIAQTGDRATFATRFRRIGGSIRAKALDDRLGVATLIELLHNPPPGIELIAAFTVQEEVGLRGARVAAHGLDPDLAIAIDCTPARDLPRYDDRENDSYNTRLGEGPAIYAADSRTLAHQGLLQHVLETAEAEGIPHQIRQPGGGGTDAGVIHLSRAGVPALSISTPARYLHTAISQANLSDWRHTVRLVHATLSSVRPANLRL